jgi:hypothetical protein
MIPKEDPSIDPITYFIETLKNNFQENEEKRISKLAEVSHLSYRLSH